MNRADDRDKAEKDGSICRSVDGGWWMNFAKRWARRHSSKNAINGKESRPQLLVVL